MFANCQVPYNIHAYTDVEQKHFNKTKIEQQSVLGWSKGFSRTPAPNTYEFKDVPPYWWDLKNIVSNCEGDNQCPQIADKVLKDDI